MSVRDNYECEGQMTMAELFPDLWSEKTSPEPSVQTKEKTLDAYSKKFAELRIKMPQYLCLRKVNGVQADASWGMDIQWLGGYTTHSFGECPSEERESRLSQILEEHPHPKYCLSAKACQGILRRAENRGKELPPLLKETLIKQSLSKNEQAVRGGARESLSSTNEQEPCQRLTTNQCLNSWDVQSKHIQPEDGKAEALYSGECRGGGGESYVMAYGISAYESNAMKSANPHSGIYEAETTRTLDNNGGNPACNQGGMVIVEGFDGYNTTPTGEVSKTITSGRNDTHNLPIVLEGNGSRPSHQGDGYKESEVSYTLNSVEQHAVCWDGGQISPTLTANNAGGGQRMPDKDNFNAVITYGIDRASFNQGKNAQYDFQVQEEIAQTIVAKGPGGVLTHK